MMFIGEFETVSVVVNEDCLREVLGVAAGMREDKVSWISDLHY